MRQIEVRALEGYRRAFGEEPTLVASAPGRINLIGEHTDYSGGFALPCAIDRRVAIALSEGDGRLYSTDFGDTESLDGCHGDTWAAYPRGVAWAFAERGQSVPKFQAAFAGDVPVASGLSSSAAIECATAIALDRLNEFDRTRTDLARICQLAENGFVGVNSGILDQYASLLCTEGHALFIDCRSLEASNVPLDLRSAGLSLVVCDTRIPRELGKTGYNDRRASVEQAARDLGVPELRDATVGDLTRLQGTELKRARHVVTEDARVLEAVEALNSRDFEAFGGLMFASHESLRDDFEVSTPELDLFVTAARSIGALGARLTGAGFGGAAIALIHSDRAETLESRAREMFEERGFAAPDFYVFSPAQGAEVVQ